MSSCAVHLNNNQTEYRPGDTITGKVVCIFSKLKSIREIKIKLKGKEHNKWPGTETYYDEIAKRKKTRPIYYTGNNIFLLVENTLKGEGDLGPGRFEFPFSLELPKNIPSSYYGRYGGVYFTISAMVDRPLKTEYTDSQQITIFSPINLEDMKDHLQLNPISYSDDKILCCWCCISGPITMDVHLEKEAFVIGEAAKIKVDINNMSNENIDRIVVRIGTTIKSIVTHPSRESKSTFELLAANSYSGVAQNLQKTYNIELEIPESAMVPNFNLCTLFEQDPKVQVTAVLSLFHEDMEITADVVVGHIPIEGDSHRQENSNNVSNDNSVTSPLFSNSQGLYPSYPPPSYSSDVANSSIATSSITTEASSSLYNGPSAPPREHEASAPRKKGTSDDPPSYAEVMSGQSK